MAPRHLSAWLAIALLSSACNTVLGFQEGKPYPPDAGSRQDSPTTSDAADDSFGRSDGGNIGADGSNGDAESGTPPEPDGASDGGCSLTVCSGQCVNTATDPKNCGACGNDCTMLPNVGSTTGVSCAARQCVIQPAACAKGYAHCTNKPDDGCETDISKPDNCNACGMNCASDKPICDPTGCKTSCTGNTPTQCGQTCVNLDNDANHCGDCTKQCPPPTGGGTATCSNKTCGVQCLAGAHACGSLCASNIDATHCGSSCVNCTTGPANSDPACTNNTCDFVCRPGFVRCGQVCIDPLVDTSH